MPLRLFRRVVPALTALAALVLCTPAAPAAAAATAPTARLSAVRVAHGTISFLVSAQGLPAGVGLDPQSVQVSADGTALAATAQSLSHADAGAAPTRVVFLLLDTSASMAGARLTAAKAAAAAYVRGLPADVRVGLIAFAAKPRLLLQPTADDTVFTAALAKLQALGGTSLYDAVAAALHAFQSQGLDAGADRRLLVLSDGADTASKATLDTVTRKLAAQDVPADVVALTSGKPSPALDMLAASAGGQVIATGDAGLTGAFATSARAVHGQLLVSARVPARLGGSSAQLRVRLTAGTHRLTATAPVVFAAAAGAGASTGAAAVPVATAPESTPALGGAWRWAVLGLCFASVFLLALVLLAPPGARTLRLRQIEAYAHAPGSAAAADPGAEGKQSAGLGGTALQLADRVVKSRAGLEERIAADLDRAGLSLTPAQWLLLRIGTVVGLAVTMILLTGSLGLGRLLAVVLSALSTRVFLRVRISRRSAKFADQLPDALQLMASSLKSGFSLSQALDSLVRQDLPPLGTEFGRALAEARIGLPVEDALDKVAERMGSQDLRWTVMAIRIQREVGGNLAEVLLATAETMRERARVRRQVRALSAEGRLSGYILIALPIGVALWMTLTRPEYLRPLYTQPVGILMSVSGVVLTVVGWFWMSKLAKVEV